MNHILRDLVAVFILLGGLAAALALLWARHVPAPRAFAVPLTAAIAILAAGAVLTLAHLSTRAAVVFVAAGSGLAVRALAVVRRDPPRRRPIQVRQSSPSMSTAVVYYTTFQAVPVGARKKAMEMSAPTLVLLPDVGGSGIELCQN